MNQYCPTCKRPTEHRANVSSLTSHCSVCNTSTSAVERSQALQIGEDRPFIAPDGNKASIVTMTPEQITFHIAKGKHKGYYINDRIHHTYEIKQDET